MADNFTANPGAGGNTFASDDIGGVQYPRSKIGFGVDGTYIDVSATDNLPVTLSAAQIAALQPLATQPVSGTVAVNNFPATQAVSGTVTANTGLSQPLTDAQLRATAVPVSGTVTANTGLSQPLTDAQLRAAAVPVSGTFFQATQPVSVSSQPLPTGASTETTLAALNTKVPALGAAAPSASAPVTLPNAVIVGAAASIAALNIDLLTGGASGWFDATNFRSVTVQIIGSVGITTGAIIFEQTNDTTAAAAGVVAPFAEITSLTPTPAIAAITIAANTVRAFSAPIVMRFLRVRVSTAFTGANVQAVASFSQAPYYQLMHSVHQATAANLQATVSGTVTANVAGAGITGGTISPLTVAGVSVEASSAKTATGNSAAAITNASGSGVMLFLNASAVSGTTPSLTVRVQVQDPVSAAWVDLPGGAFNAVTAVTATPFLLTISAGVTAVANAAVNLPLPRTWRLAWVISGTTPSFTFSVGAQYLI